MNWAVWFRAFWPSRWQQVLAEYHTIGRNHRLFLADVALRGNVFSRLDPPPPDAWQAGRAEGRRELALEIFKLCNADPAQLHALVETFKTKDTRS